MVEKHCLYHQSIVKEKSSRLEWEQKLRRDTANVLNNLRQNLRDQMGQYITGTHYTLRLILFTVNNRSMDEGFIVRWRKAISLYWNAEELS
jgi:hypothetical protein